MRRGLLVGIQPAEPVEQCSFEVSTPHEHTIAPLQRWAPQYTVLGRPALARVARRIVPVARTTWSWNNVRVAVSASFPSLRFRGQRPARTFKMHATQGTDCKQRLAFACCWESSTICPHGPLASRCGMRHVLESSTEPGPRPGRKPSVVAYKSWMIGTCHHARCRRLTAHRQCQAAVLR